MQAEHFDDTQSFEDNTLTYPLACSKVAGNVSAGIDDPEAIESVIALFNRDFYATPNLAKFKAHYDFIVSLLAIKKRKLTASHIEIVHNTAIPLFNHLRDLGIAVIDNMNLDALIIILNPKFSSFRKVANEIFNISLKLCEINNEKAKQCISVGQIERSLIYFKLAEESFIVLDEKLESLSGLNSDFAFIYRALLQRVISIKIQVRIQEYQLTVNTAISGTETLKEIILALFAQLATLAEVPIKLKRTFERVGKPDKKYRLSIPDIDDKAAFMTMAELKIYTQKKSEDLTAELNAEPTEKPTLRIKKKKKKKKKKPKSKGAAAPNGNSAASSSSYSSVHHALSETTTPTYLLDDPAYRFHQSQVDCLSNTLKHSNSPIDKSERLFKLLKSQHYLVHCYARHSKKTTLNKRVKVFFDNLLLLFKNRNQLAMDEMLSLDSQSLTLIDDLKAIPLDEANMTQQANFILLATEHRPYICLESLKKKIPAPVVKELNKLNDSNQTTLLLGGATRQYAQEIIEGNLQVSETQPDNFDFITTYTIDELRLLFDKTEVHGGQRQTLYIVEKGMTIKFCHFEGDIEENLSTRDFPMNMICFDYHRTLIHDPFQGATDIYHQIITCHDSAAENFSRARVHPLRAIVFQATLGYQFSDDILSAIQTTPSAIQGVNQDRLFSEFKKIICHEKATDILTALNDYHLWEYLFPTWQPLMAIPNEDHFEKLKSVLTLANEQLMGSDKKITLTIATMVLPLLKLESLNGLTIQFISQKFESCVRQLGSTVNIQRQYTEAASELLISLFAKGKQDRSMEILSTVYSKKQTSGATFNIK